MPEWLLLVLGALAGLLVVGGALFLGARPYLGAVTPRSRLPDPTGRAVPPSIVGTDSGPAGS